MRWIYTRWIITAVEYVDSFGDRVIENFPGSSMGFNHPVFLPTFSYKPIQLAIFTPKPRPTAISIRRAYLEEETIFKGLASRTWVGRLFFRHNSTPSQ